MGDDDGDKLLRRVDTDRFTRDDGEAADVCRRPTAAEILELNGFVQVDVFEAANYGVKIVNVACGKGNGVSNSCFLETAAGNLKLV